MNYRITSGRYAGVRVEVDGEYEHVFVYRDGDDECPLFLRREEFERDWVANGLAPLAEEKPMSCPVCHYPLTPWGECSGCGHTPEKAKAGHLCEGGAQCPHGADSTHWVDTAQEDTWGALGRALDRLESAPVQAPTTPKEEWYDIACSSCGGSIRVRDDGSSVGVGCCPHCGN